MGDDEDKPSKPIPFGSAKPVDKAEKEEDSGARKPAPWARNKDADAPKDDAKEEDKKALPPWKRNKDATKKEDDDDEDGPKDKEEDKEDEEEDPKPALKPSAGKWVPPSQR